MKRFLLAGITAGALCGAPAHAADIPVKTPIYKAPVIVPYNWTGLYVGGNIGYSWGHATTDTVAPDLVFSVLPSAISTSLRPDGLIGGAQVGYNWQRDNSWVFGIEADIQGSAEKNSNTRIDPFTIFEQGQPYSVGTVTRILETKIQWFDTVRGRTGVLLNPTTLLYGTGGLAYGEINNSDAVKIHTTLPLPFTGVTTIGDSKTKFGWTVGAGVEGYILNSREWTWKVEYLYINFGSLNGAGTDLIAGPYRLSTKVTDNIVRIGLNYKFGNQ